MAIMTEATLIETIKNELTAGMVNVELTDAMIKQIIQRALLISSDYFTYTDFKTLEVIPVSAMGGYINLSDIDVTGNKVPSIINVFPTVGTTNVEGSILGLGSFYLQGNTGLQSYINNYSLMLNKLSMLDSLIGRGARVVGDKLYLDKFVGSVTVEYIPNEVEIEKIHQGSWIMWIIDYSVALAKRHIAQARGKYVVDSNPFTINAATLLDEARTDIERLEAQLQTKGVLQVTR